MPSDHVAVLSGPNLSREIALGEPTATVIACRDHDRAVALQHACMTGYFRSYTNTDVVGCELGGAGKNVIALAVGMAAGMGLGDNSRASLITRGLAEISRLGVALGADPMTFAGLAGLGDLVATCSSPLSRNRTFGERLGRGESLAQAEAANHGQVAEGVKSCVSICQLGERHGVELPISDAVRRVCHEGLLARGAGQGADQPGPPRRVAPSSAHPRRQSTALRSHSAVRRGAPTALWLRSAERGRHRLDVMDEGDGTRCVHGGHAVHGSAGDPLHPGPVLSTAFHLDPAEPPDLFYGRAGNPTWTALEAAIGALDGGECVTFASGMAAITAVLRLCARPGRAIVLPSDGYYATRSFAHAELAPLGVEVREVPTAGPWPDGMLDGATLAPDRDPVQPRARCPRHPRDRPRCPRRRRPAGRRQHHRHPARPAPAGAGRRPRRRRRHQGARRARRRPARPRQHRRPRARRAPRGRPAPSAAPSPARWRPGSSTVDWPHWTCASLARPPTPRAGRHAARPPRRDRRPLARPARRPGPRRRHRADAAVERRSALHAALGRGCCRVPGRLALHDLGHQLRRAPQQRGPARALGRRRPARSGALLRRLRRHRRPRHRRLPRARLRYHPDANRARLWFAGSSGGGGAMPERQPDPGHSEPGDALPLARPTGSRVLLLNATFEPLAVVTAKRAVVLMLTGKAECVEAALEGAFHSECLTIPTPSVMRLSRYVRVPYRRPVPMTRAGDPASRRPPLRLLHPPRRHHRPRRSPQPRRHPQLGELRRGVSRCATRARRTGCSTSWAGRCA